MHHAIIIIKDINADTIDLCTTEGEVKALHCHSDDNAANFFTLRELCLAVRVQGQSVRQ